MPTTATKKYKVTTSRQEVETVEATRVELETSGNRLTFYKGDELVASFVGYSSFVVEA